MRLSEFINSMNNVLPGKVFILNLYCVDNRSLSVENINVSNFF